MCRKMKKFENDFHISFFNLTQFFLAFELKLVIFLFTFLISCLFTIFRTQDLNKLEWVQEVQIVRLKVF